MIVRKQLLKWTTKRFFCYATDEALKMRILDRAVQLAPTVGWNDDCLTAAVQVLNLPPLTQQVINNGAADLVCHFLERKRVHVNEVMSNLSSQEEVHSASEQSESENEKIVAAIESHLEYILPHQNNWDEALSVCIDPRNYRLTMAALFRLVDDLCFFSGSKGSQIDWYSERGLMALLYISTELYFLTDKSDNFQDTRSVI